MQPGQTPPMWAQLLPLVVVIVVLTIRFLRPQRLTVTRMWLQPIILCLLAAWVVYAGELIFPAPVWEIGLGIVIGAIAGVPFGILRGMHTDVRPTEKPGVMYLGSSWITMVVFVAAFGLRFGIRQIMPHRGSLASAVGDAMMGFAISFVVTSYVAIYRKYQAELAGRIVAPPPPAI